ncbi:MAG: hypothetical protein MZV63_63625 [Marinilabiliales bacterium]|nr:hypothetical protein [Marinilabiliales bacterium]
MPSVRISRRSGKPDPNRIRGTLPSAMNSIELKSVSVGDASNHPTWKMGSKITIDSATLTEQGTRGYRGAFPFRHPLRQDPCEDPSPERHPLDGGIQGRFDYQPDGKPDMQLPINTPSSIPTGSLPHYRFDIAGNITLSFSDPDRATFRCLDIAYRCGKRALSSVP